MGSKSPSKASSKSSKTSVKSVPDVDECCRADFIYGGPFIKAMKVEPFLDTATPINLQLQGTFKRSFAYYSLKERLPVILTKIIDYCSRQGPKIKSSSGASDSDLQSYIKYISKLKNDLVTNKKYDLLTVESADAKKWNSWLENQDQPHYFTNVWLFSECYVYRRIREGCELANKLSNFDPFDEQKDKSFSDSLELMCVVAEKMLTMLPRSDKDRRKADFITLLKLCLWSNKCDLSLSLGEGVSLSGKPGSKGSPPLDPFQMIVDLKDKLLVDDTGKIADLVIAKGEAMAKAIDGPLPSSVPSSRKGSPPRSPPPAPVEGEGGPKPPCPAKMTVPQAVMFDIICDNAGYELFTDLCLAHFLIAQNIVQKVRFHVKNMPWFVSDVTCRDFKFVIDSCAAANYSRTVETEPKSAPAEGAAPLSEEPKVISSDSLKQLAQQWNAFVADGTFVLLAEDYWTWPHPYKDMKKYDPNLYRKLQLGTALLFKGDLNYRKLLGEKNWVPTTGFEASLQGFIPGPIIAARTVKSDLISGLPKGKYEQITKIDENWMQKGDYGVIQLCAKAEPLKVSDRPCEDYGHTCFGLTCPMHNDL